MSLTVWTTKITNAFANTVLLAHLRVCLMRLLALLVSRFHLNVYKSFNFFFYAGAPLFFSLPHFFNADPTLKEAITGLNSHPDVRDTYLDLHPKFGTMLRGKIKLQVNVRVEKSYGVSALKNYPDGLMLPLAWVEFVSYTGFIT